MPHAALRRSVTLETDDVVNVNMTSALLELFRVVRNNWTEDFYSPLAGSPSPLQDSSSTGGALYRHRTPFVPFALYNATGSSLHFRTQTAISQLPIDARHSLPAAADSTESSSSSQSAVCTQRRWVACDPGSVVSFSFDKLSKLRHHDTHELQTHQIVIRIEGWLEVGPVSVDKIGVYFRYASVRIIEQPFNQQPQQ